MLNTLDSIIDDIINELRNNNVAESDTTSRRQIEQWITHYRSLLIKQDIDKGRDLNDDYIQEILDLEFTDKDSEGVTISKTEAYILKSKTTIPNGIDFHFKYGITAIVDEFGNHIQLSSEKRAILQSARNYSKKETIAYKRNGYLYLVGVGSTKTVDIRIIAEDPMSSAFGLSGSDRYPIPANMIAALKALIFEKEFKITAPVDNKNNSANDIENLSANGKKD